MQVGASFKEITISNHRVRTSPTWNTHKSTSPLEILKIIMECHNKKNAYLCCTQYSNTLATFFCHIHSDSARVQLLLPEGTDEVSLLFLSYIKTNSKIPPGPLPSPSLALQLNVILILGYFHSLYHKHRFKSFPPNIKKAKLPVNKRLNHFYKT